ncbi:aspartyl-tRNA synthetase [Bacillus salacetis]|uniref:Aspartyl-tRNA synthetase n=1 Tax=Bacillus salacetis TaxID=2315464 RepID=A0A3A1R7Q3_9BACI|nr:aspartyl-tRNA synthetase [Bacillus salacetis]RIW37363.1 aspartyl-tRNA synthetase [Bacillus salacetis]
MLKLGDIGKSEGEIMEKHSIIKMVGFILFFAALLITWGFQEQQSSYREPHQAILAEDNDLVLIPSYIMNGKALYFFIKDGNNLGATMVDEGIFGWKAGMFTWSPIGNIEDLDEISGYQGHGDHLVYGLIRDGDENMITIDGQPADILNLEMLPQTVVKDNNLEGLSLWYFEKEEAGELKELNLVQRDTGEVLQVVDL